MSRYLSTEKGVYSVFGDQKWIAEKIPTYPANFIAKVSEYIRVNIIPSGNGVNRNSISGVVIIDIFVAVGEGSNRTFEIADKLDSYLKSTWHTAANGRIQFQLSALGRGETDKANPLLFKTSYTIPFNFFESL